jgi:hypothetical protein
MPYSKQCNYYNNIFFSFQGVANHGAAYSKRLDAFLQFFAGKWKNLRVVEYCTAKTTSTSFYLKPSSKSIDRDVCVRKEVTIKI